MEKITNLINSIVELINRVDSFLSGYRTYIIACIMIITGLIQGDNRLVLEGIAFITVRSGFKNEVGKAQKDANNS